MKKGNFVFLVLFIASVFFLSAINVWAQAAPAFDQQPSVVLDLWSNGYKGKYKDNIKFMNATLLRNVSFRVLGYDEKNRTWTQIGTSLLKNVSDTDTVNSQMKGKLNQFRWFAVHSPDNNIKFTAQALAKSNDVYITVLDIAPAAVTLSNNNTPPTFNLQSSIVLDLHEKVGRGKYKDSLKITSGSTRQNISFNVFGYDQKNGQWIIIGPKKLNDTEGDSTPMEWGPWGVSPDSINTPWKDSLNEFRWIAVQSLNGIPFDVQASASRNDLNIKIVDK
jgi:hypothetical protein